jgi:hypothetical protein
MSGAQGRLSEALTGTIGPSPAVNGVDDLGVVDSLEVDRGDAEVAVPELALNDDERDAFVGHLDSVGVAS